MNEAQRRAVDSFNKMRKLNIITLQLENHYQNSNMEENRRRLKAGRHYHHNRVSTRLKWNHPRFSELSLIWTITGKWLKLPTNNETGRLIEANLTSFNIGRVENYVTEEGEIKQAFAYGDRDSDLLVWYQMEDLQAFFCNFEFPSIPVWENSRKWREDLQIDCGGDNTRENIRGNFRNGG